MNLEQACAAALVDPRIGVLCREGRPVFYAMVEGECVQRATVAAVVAVLNGDAVGVDESDAYTYYKAVHPVTGAVAVRRTLTASYEYAAMTKLGGASWANSLKRAKASNYGHLGAIVAAEEITRDEYRALKSGH